MTARQPGEGRQGAKVSPETGTMWRRQCNQRLPFSISLQPARPFGEISLGKIRKKPAQQYEVLLSGEFWGAHDFWTEYLCMDRNKDGSITLTSRSREILAESGRYRKRGWLPATIRRKEVWGYDGDYVVGGRLLQHDGDAEMTVSLNQFDVAARWLIRRKWNLQPEFGEAWAQIRSALYAPGFFNPTKSLPTLRSIASDDSENESFAASNPGCADERTAPQPGGHKPCEIVIRCAGPSKPWIIWLEIVFIEWSQSSFSIFARAGEAVPGGAVSLGPLPRTAGRLSWREVLAFVQSHDLAAISGSDSQPIDIYGVLPWQRDVIAAAMMRLSEIVPFLVRLPESELQSLHERLDGFLSQSSIHRLSRLAVVTGPLLAGTPLTKIAQLVGSSDPLDLERLAEGCQAYRAERHAEQVLAQHRDTPAPPPELFLSLLGYEQPCSRLRAGLFELWLRAKPKPKGGHLFCGRMDDELPVLHWLLREQAVEIFQCLVGTHRKAIEEFVPWFLDKARPYTCYFTGGYNFSFITYAYGRPRFATWAKLGKEVQDAASSLGVPLPEVSGLPAMPDLEIPTRWSLVTSSTGISHRHLKRMAEQLAVREPGERDSDQ